MSDVNLSITDGQDVYLSITETPSVVTLSQPVFATQVAATVTVGNVVSVNVVTMPALSISSVSVSNFPASTTVTGTVALDTASLAALESITVTVGNVTIGSSITVSNLTALNNAVGTDGSTPASNNFVKIGGHQDGNNSVEHIAHVSAGGALKVDASDSAVTFGNIRGTVTVSSLPSVSGTVTANVFGYDSQNEENLRIGLISYGSGPQLRGAIEVIGADANPLPISGTVTANVALLADTTALGSAAFGVSGDDVNAIRTVIYSSANSEFGSDQGHPVDSSNPLPVSVRDFASSVTSQLTALRSDDDVISSQPLWCVDSGTGVGGANQLVVRVGNSGFGGQQIPIVGTVTVGNSVTISSIPAISGTVTVSSLPAISGTVTVNSIYPKITFIDGSGSVVTADSAIEVFATSSTRSYLLVQVTTGSAYVNVGATATTANGIYLGTGQGYAWETTIPQGIVSLISSVTGTAYCAKQA